MLSFPLEAFLLSSFGESCVVSATNSGMDCSSRSCFGLSCTESFVHGFLCHSEAILLALEKCLLLSFGLGSGSSMYSSDSLSSGSSTLVIFE